MSVQVIDTLKPKNNGTFPVVEAEDVAVSDELRLPEALSQKAEQTDLEELNSALEEKADTSDISNLQSQIDQIAQAAGTGTADTEVAQARVGTDGTNYQTLKGRLDAENSVINGDLKECAYLNYDKTFEVDVNENIVEHYKFIKGHTYTVSNLSTTSGSVTVETRENDKTTRIDLIAGSMPPNYTLEFTPTADAEYVRINNGGTATTEIRISDNNSVEKLIDNLSEEVAENITQATDEIQQTTDSLAANINFINNSIFTAETFTGTNLSISSDTACNAIATSGANIKHSNKNEIIYPYASPSSSSYNIQYTINEDGTVKATGTSTGSSTFDLVKSGLSSRKPIKKGKYFLSGCPAGGSTSTYMIVVGITDVGEFRDTGNGVVVDIPNDTTYYAYITIKNGTVADLLFSPQIELGSAKTSYHKREEETITVVDESIPVNLYSGVNRFYSENNFDISYYVASEGSNGILNLKDLGAKGDGETDDTVAINNALILAEKNSLFIPEGTYIFSGTLHIKTGTHLYGCGEASVFKAASGRTLDAEDWRTEVLSNSRYKYPMIAIDADAKGCHLENFALSGYGATWIDENEDGIMVRGSNHILNNLVIHDINYSNEDFIGRNCLCPAWGIDIINASTVEVNNCHVYNCGYECIGTENCDTVSICNSRFGEGCQVRTQIHRLSKHIKFHDNTVYVSSNARSENVPAITFDADPDVAMNDIAVCNNTLEGHVNTVAGGENNIRILGNNITGIFYTNTSENYIENLIICNNNIEGRINMRADKVLISNNIIENDTENYMIRIYGNSVLFGDNLGTGRTNDTTIVPHTEE